MFAEYGYSSCDKNQKRNHPLFDGRWKSTFIIWMEPEMGLWTSNVIFCAGCVCVECIQFSLEKKRVMY